MGIMNILYFIGASVMLTLAPGPDILFVITQSISKSRKDGIVIALGLCTGLIAHTTAAALGISVILSHSATAFQILKFAGALYLFYLTWQAFKESRTSHISTLSAASNQSFWALYRRGILMNILNPKVSLFFLAFLPQFVSPQAGSVPLQMIILGAIFMAQALLVFTLVSILAHQLGKKFLNNMKAMVWVNCTKAGIYAILGARLLFLDQE